jgi:chromosome segregation ATPase
MAETEEPPSENVASHTLAFLRRIEKRLEQMWEVLLRHDTRLGRIERNLNEVKSDVVLLENRTLTQSNEILGFVREIQTVDGKLDQALAQISSLDQKVGRLDRERGSC